MRIMPSALLAIRAGDWSCTCPLCCVSLPSKLALLPQLRLQGLTAACSLALRVPQQTASIRVRLKALAAELSALCREGEKLRVLPCRHRFHMVGCLQRCLVKLVAGRRAACLVL